MANELNIKGQDGQTLYAIIRRKSDAKVWDITNTAWATWSDGSIGDYDLQFTAKSGDLYQATFPTSIASGTNVLVSYYKQAGASPATSDLLLAARDFTWNGTDLTSSSSVSLQAGNLTTLAAVQRHLRITGTADDTLLTDLINIISDKIKRFTGRDFTSTQYYEWHSGEFEDELVLKQRPVIYINRVGTGNGNAFTVNYSGSDIQAIVQVHPDGVRLQSISAAGTVTNSEVDFATYPTVSTIVTQINTVSNWTATTQNDTKGQYLHQTGGVDAKSQTVQMSYADSFTSNYRVDYKNGTLGFASGITGRIFGDPLLSFGYGAFRPTTATPGGYRNIVVDYTAGYATIPDDIDYAARVLVSEAYHLGKRDTSLQSENLGTYSYTLADRATNDERMMALLGDYVNAGGFIA